MCSLIFIQCIFNHFIIDFIRIINGWVFTNQIWIDVNPIVMNGISTGTSNHDFFSQVGNGYLLGTVEAMQDDDYNYGLK